MAIHDTCAHRMKRTDAPKSGLQFEGFGSTQPDKISHAVLRRTSGYLVENAQLIMVDGNNELSAQRIWDGTRLAVVDEQFASLNAQARHETARGIVDAGVNNLAVSGRSMHPDRNFPFQHDYLVPCARQLTSDGKTDNACSDHDAVDFGHVDGYPPT
jgi:hypothetical protein